MTDTFFEVQKIHKFFGKLTALNDVSFSVKRGEVLGLIGPNGAGKTTLFNVVTGFYRASSGSVIFKGVEVTRDSPDKLAGMGMVRTFQIPRPFKELSVHDNIAVGTLFNPRRMKELKMSSEKFIDRILDELGLTEYKNEFAEKLSYGNLKMLELGRSQGTAPELLLLDEPFAGLNANEIDEISHIIKRMSDAGITLIIVEHKLRELMKLVNRIIVLHYGKKIGDGPPEEISQNDEVLKAYLGRRWSANA